MELKQVCGTTSYVKNTSFNLKLRRIKRISAPKSGISYVKMRISPKIGHNYYVSRLLTGYLLVLLSLLTINSTNAKQGKNCFIFYKFFILIKNTRALFIFFNLTSIILKFCEQYLEFKNLFFKFKYSAQLLIAEYFRKYTLNL
jgi:hypothetical protein